MKDKEKADQELVLLIRIKEKEQALEQQLEHKMEERLAQVVAREEAQQQAMLDDLKQSQCAALEAVRAERDQALELARTLALEESQANGAMARLTSEAGQEHAKLLVSLFSKQPIFFRFRPPPSLYYTHTHHPPTLFP